MHADVYRYILLLCIKISLMYFATFLSKTPLNIQYKVISENYTLYRQIYANNKIKFKYLFSCYYDHLFISKFQGGGGIP